MLNSKNTDAHAFSTSIIEGAAANIDQALVASMKEKFDAMSSLFKAGTIVSATIIQKDNSGVLVSIDYKSDSFIPASEFSNQEFAAIEPNSVITVLLEQLEDVNGMVVLSYQKAKIVKSWEIIGEALEKGLPITGKVLQRVKGGLSVDIGITAFLPGSQLDFYKVTNFDQFVGNEVTCKVLKVNRRRGNVILSRRKYLEEARDVDKKRTLDNLSEGQIVTGAVKNITNYGVFVDVGGIDGLLHVTDMSWGRVSHPSEIFKIGDQVEVIVVSVDKEAERVSLGIKQLQQNPWVGIEQKYPVGTKIVGTIAGIADYGLFVEIAPGVEGLVHISEVSWTERVHNLSKRFTVGDKVEVVVSGINIESRKMSLSIKRLELDPWGAAFEKLQVGQILTGKINNIADFGVFVQIFEGVDGLVHVSDISWTEHIIHPSEKFKKGDEVKVCVLSIDKEARKISLGIKQLENDPWVSIEKDYPVGASVEGVVTKVAPFGVFVKLKSGIEGLAHISELNATGGVGKFSVGDKLNLWVVRVSQADRKLGLSLVPGGQQRAAAGQEQSSHREEGSSWHKPAPKQHSASSEKEVSDKPYVRPETRSNARVEDDSNDNFSQSKQAPAKGSLQLALEKKIKSTKE